MRRVLLRAIRSGWLESTAILMCFWVRQFDWDIPSICAGTASRKEAAKLAGKLQFAKGQVLGKGVDPCLASLHLRVSRPGILKKFTFEETEDLKELKSHIELDPPRMVHVAADDRPLLLFTDGSSVQDVHMFGAVLVDTAVGVTQVAWGHVPDELIQFWKRCVGEQLITQIELYPLVAWRWMAGRQWLNCRILCFIDNEAARHNMIKGSSPSLASRLLLKAFIKVEREAPSFFWFARVPSFSNVADAPSRGLAEQTAKRLGAEVISLGACRQMLEVITGKCRWEWEECTWHCEWEFFPYKPLFQHSLLKMEKVSGCGCVSL